jgi:hypothetical protein
MASGPFSTRKVERIFERSRPCHAKALGPADASEVVRFWPKFNPVAIKVLADVLFKAGNDVAKELLRARQLRFERRHAIREVVGAVLVLGDLALLVEVPEEAHESTARGG